MEIKPKSEARIQEDAFKFIRKHHPETYGCLWHVPNGGLRDKVGVRTFAGQGVVPGIQDIHFLWEGNFYVIEIKRPDGQVSAEQKLIHAIHAKHGKMTYLFKTSEGIIYFVQAILSGAGIDNFVPYISRFARPEMIDIYRQEAFVERERRAQAKAKKKAA